MTTKRCTKLKVTSKRYRIFFKGHPSNVNVTRDNNSPILAWIERFQTATPVWIHWWLWNSLWWSLEEVPYCFSRSSNQFLGHTGWKINDFNPMWVRLLGQSQLPNLPDLPCCYWLGSHHQWMISKVSSISRLRRLLDLCQIFWITEDMKYHAWLFWHSCHTNTS